MLARVLPSFAGETESQVLAPQFYSWKYNRTIAIIQTDEGATQKVLLTANVQVIDNNDCSYIYNGTNVFDSSLCAISMAKDDGNCQVNRWDTWFLKSILSTNYNGYLRMKAAVVPWLLEDVKLESPVGEKDAWIPSTLEFTLESKIT